MLLRLNEERNKIGDRPEPQCQMNIEQDDCVNVTLGESKHHPIVARNATGDFQNPERSEVDTADQLSSAWFQYSAHHPTLSEVKTAARLAWEGQLTAVRNMEIVNIDISDIPNEQIEKLTSNVTERVYIKNMTPNGQINRILASLKNPYGVLWLHGMVLSKADTRLMVTAMRDLLEIVTLYGDMTLDIEEMTKYDGQGHCNTICVADETRRKYGARFRRWAERWKWTVRREDDNSLEFERKSKLKCRIM